MQFFYSNYREYRPSGLMQRATLHTTPLLLHFMRKLMLSLTYDLTPEAKTTQLARRVELNLALALIYACQGNIKYCKK
jgi:hypothetical protein